MNVPNDDVEQRIIDQTMEATLHLVPGSGMSVNEWIMVAETYPWLYALPRYREQVSKR